LKVGGKKMKLIKKTLIVFRELTYDSIRYVLFKLEEKLSKEDESR